MAKLRNTNPLGQVDVPLIGRQGDTDGRTGIGCLEPDEEFECSREHALLLLGQSGNFEPVDAEARTIAQDLRDASEQDGDAEQQDGQAGGDAGDDDQQSGGGE